MNPPPVRPRPPTGARPERSAERSAEDLSEAQSWLDLAIEHERQGDLSAAFEAVLSAERLAPGALPIVIMKASLELAQGRPADALETASRGKTGKNDPLAGVLHALCGRAQDDLGRPERAYAEYRLANRDLANDIAFQADRSYLAARLCDWKTFAALWPRVREAATLSAPQKPAAINPFLTLYSSDDRRLQKQVAQNWSAQFDQGLARPARRNRGRRIRIGYLSSDLRNHPVGLLTVGLFEQHDRQRFEVFGYSTGPNERSAARTRIEAAFEHFLDAAALSDAALAQRIRGDRIDILIDLNGHTALSRSAVGAFRPAPVQVAYLGYPGTSGAPWIDYLLADAQVAPEDCAEDFSEAIARLPYSFQINDDRREVGSAPTRAALGLPESGVVFCCFHAGFKITALRFAAWVRIARSVPGSVLWLLLRAKEGPPRAVLEAAATAQGLDPKRLVFIDSDPLGRSYADYLALFTVADLFLDATPYGAHATAAEALFSGCPVVTSKGQSYASRVGASVLSAAGLPELIADTDSDFESLAIALANDPDRRARLRDHLQGAGRRSPLFDTAGTTRAIERAYETMLAQCAGRGPESFTVAADPDTTRVRSWRDHLGAWSTRLWRAR
jgi:predicted O-linked N-acetylglucosamine transferase (SPINDLY family)